MAPDCMSINAQGWIRTGLRTIRKGSTNVFGIVATVHLGLLQSSQFSNDYKQNKPLEKKVC